MHVMLQHSYIFSNYYNFQSVHFELLYTALVLYAGGRPVPSCKSPMQASMVGVSNSLWSYPSRPMFVLVAICSLAMCWHSHGTYCFNIMCYFYSAMYWHLHGYCTI